MFNFINQNSLVIVSVLLSIIISMVIGKQLGYKWSVASIATSFIVIAVLLTLTSTKTNKIETIDEFNAVLTTDNPSLIYIYSDW